MNIRTILVVDDNAAFVELAAEEFGAEYNVVSSPNGLDGLAKAGEILPDLVLLDVNMPGLNGVEFARKLAANHKTRRIPVIVVTATDYNSLTQSLLAKEANVKSFLSKMTPFEILKAKVAGVINTGAL